MPELRTIDISNIQTGLRNFTKWAISVIVGLALLMQIDIVKNFITPILTQHPKIASIVMGLAGIGLLLQNPAVQRILHLDITGTTVKISDSNGNQLVETKMVQAVMPVTAAPSMLVTSTTAGSFSATAPALVPAPAPTASIRLSL